QNTAAKDRQYKLSRTVKIFGPNARAYWHLRLRSWRPFKLGQLTTVDRRPMLWVSPSASDPTMNFVLRPCQLLSLILAGWVNRQQQQVIDYLRTENQILREKIGKRRILLDDDQRRRLAVKGKVLGRKVLAQAGTLVTPDTILRWHRLLVAQKWD